MKADDDTLSLSSVTDNDKVYHEACTSISFGNNYTVGTSGDVTATAPSVTLGPNTNINGEFAVTTAVP